MKICRRCNRSMGDEDMFCQGCGAPYQEGELANSTLNNQTSTFIRYSGYLDDDALFNVALAKEQGIVKSEFPGEAETIYGNLAMKGHTESMYRYALLLLANPIPEEELACRWLLIAAKAGNASATNYLNTSGRWLLDRYGGSLPGAGNVHTGEGEEEKPETPTVERSTVLSGEEVYAKMSDAVVEVLASNGRGEAQSSGFIVSSTGFVVTNAHAVLDDKGKLCTSIRVKLHGEMYNAVVLAMGSPAVRGHNTVDIALLFAGGMKNAGCAELGDSSACRNGQGVYLIGNSLGRGLCMTSGIISDAARSMPDLSYPYIMTDAAANHGNSGGPLIGADGKVIGVLVAGIENAEGMNFVIPINVVKQFLAYVIEQAHLSESVAGELANLSYVEEGTDAKAMDFRKLLEGIQIALGVVTFILGFF